MNKIATGLVGLLLIGTADAQHISDSNYVKIGNTNLMGMRAIVYEKNNEYLLKLFSAKKPFALFELNNDHLKYESIHDSVVYTYDGSYTIRKRVLNQDAKNAGLSAPGDAFSRIPKYEWKSYEPTGAELSNMKLMVDSLKVYIRNALKRIRK
jgi:hypothetical protein